MTKSSNFDRAVRKAQNRINTGLPITRKEAELLYDFKELKNTKARNVIGIAGYGALTCVCLGGGAMPLLKPYNSKMPAEASLILFLFAVIFVGVTIESCKDYAKVRYSEKSLRRHFDKNLGLYTEILAERRALANDLYSNRIK